MHSDKGPVSLADISIRQGISLSYLEQLFAKMRRNKPWLWHFANIVTWIIHP